MNQTSEPMVTLGNNAGPLITTDARASMVDTRTKVSMSLKDLRLLEIVVRFNIHLQYLKDKTIDVLILRDAAQIGTCRVVFDPDINIYRQVEWAVMDCDDHDSIAKWLIHQTMRSELTEFYGVLDIAEITWTGECFKVIAKSIIGKKFPPESIPHHSV